MWWLAQHHEDGWSDANGTKLLSKNKRKAIELYERGARLGNTSCMLSLAALLGSGPRGDLAAALRLERRAAQKGEPLGAFNAGVSYKNQGKHRAAYTWFRKAAALGDDGAWLEIAKAQLFGKGTSRDVRAAVLALRRVMESERLSEGEREEATLLLAYLHMDGWLVKRSRSEALQLLRQAARRGSAVARALQPCV